MNSKKFIIIIGALLPLFQSVFAEEIPGQKDFAEVTREITKESATINADVTQFNKQQEAEAQTSQDKLKELESLIDARVKSEGVYKENPNDANYDALVNAQRAEENSKNAIINDMTDSVLSQIRFVNGLSVKYYKLGNLIAKFGKLTETYGKDQKIDTSNLTRELENSIINSANVVQGLLESMPEESEDLNAILDSLDNEAAMLGDTSQEFAASEQIKRTSEMLKDYSAQLIKIKRHLENQKKGIALAALQAYISNIENKIASFTQGVTGQNFIQKIYGLSSEGNKKLSNFQKVINKGKTQTSQSRTSEKRRSNLENLKRKHQQ